MFNPLQFWVIFSKYAFRLITLSNIDMAETVNIPITLQQDLNYNDYTILGDTVDVILAYENTCNMPLFT